MPQLGAGLLLPRLTPSRSCPNCTSEHPRSILSGAALAFFHPRTHLIPRHVQLPAQIPPLLHFLLLGRKEGEEKKKSRKKSPSQAPCQDCRQFGDCRSRESRHAPALAGVLLEKPGAEGFFLQPVMSHPDPASSSSCPWKTRWEAGLPVPTAGTHTHGWAPAPMHHSWALRFFLARSPAPLAGSGLLQDSSMLAYEIPPYFFPPSFVQPLSLHPPRLCTHRNISPCQAGHHPKQKSQREEKENKEKLSLRRADSLSVGLCGGVSSEARCGI